MFHYIISATRTISSCPNDSGLSCIDVTRDCIYRHADLKITGSCNNNNGQKIKITKPNNKKIKQTSELITLSDNSIQGLTKASFTAAKRKHNKKDLFQRLQNKPSRIWDEQQHKQEDINC